MAQLVDLLAMLCRKGFGATKLQTLDIPLGLVTLGHLYEAEEASQWKTPGDFGSEGIDGKLVIYRTDPTGKSTHVWREADADSRDMFSQPELDAIERLIDRIGLEPVLLAIYLVCRGREERATRTKADEERKRWDRAATIIADAHKRVGEP